MVKTFCDRCGREIKYKDKSYRFIGQNQRSPKQERKYPQYSVEGTTLCVKCWEKLLRFLKGEEIKGADRRPV